MRSDDAFIRSLDDWMHGIKNTAGLVIDVRGNGGGSQDCLETLLPYFMEPGAPLRVVNVAAYRLPVKLPKPNPSGFLGLYGRGLHPASKFSQWHGMGVRPSTNPKAYHYQKPTVLRSDAGSFSATDNFLGAFRGIANVTPMGTPSGGGSGRMQSDTLPGSNIPLTLCQMASFQRDGHIYDGHGVLPEVTLQPAPADSLVGGGDSVLEAALARIVAAP